MAAKLTAEQRDTLLLLERLLPKLSAKDAAFAQQLIANSRQYGCTSGRDKWIAEMTLRALGQAQPEAQPTTAVGDFAGVYGLFQTAGQNLKFPKIRLQLGNGQPLVLAIAGPKSKEPGVINVTDGRGYPENRWYGRVKPDGTWTKSHKTMDELPEVEGLLKKLGEAPAATAAEYGRLTGRCCFCNLPLENEQSTAAGFGPTCAGNFGLTAQWKAAQPVLPQLA